MSSSMVSIALSVVVNNLKNDLKILEHQIRVNKDGNLIVSHDGAELVVCAPLAYKAMIPKKYSGFDVRFVEWKEEPEKKEALVFEHIGLDEEIDNQGFFHGLYWLDNLIEQAVVMMPIDERHRFEESQIQELYSFFQGYTWNSNI